MANRYVRPEHCSIPDCESCPYDDCVYDKIEKTDKEYLTKLNLWVSYQNSCLNGWREVFECHNPMIVSNEHIGLIQHVCVPDEI